MGARSTVVSMAWNRSPWLAAAALTLLSGCASAPQGPSPAETAAAAKTPESESGGAQTGGTGSTGAEERIAFEAPPQPPAESGHGAGRMSPEEMAARIQADVAAVQERAMAGPAAGDEAARPRPPRIAWNGPGGGAAEEPARPDGAGERDGKDARSGPAAARTPDVVGRPEDVLDPPADLPGPGPERAPAAEQEQEPEQAQEPSTSDPAEVAEALAPDRIGELIVELSRELYRESAYADAPLRELFVIAAHSIVRPDRVLTAEAIPGLTDRERLVLEQFQGFCKTLGDGMRQAEDPADALRESLDGLRAALVDHPLEIATAALCYRVNGFGDYDAFGRQAFMAHEQQRVIIYLEIEGFTSELNAAQEWVTELSQQLVIYSDHDGIPVWSADWQPAVDVSRHQRQDFFTVQVVTLPKALSVGRYHFKVRLRDEKSGAETETSVAFEMVADAKLAARVP